MSDAIMVFLFALVGSVIGQVISDRMTINEIRKAERNRQQGGGVG